MSHIFIDRSSTYLDGVLGLAYVNEAYECPNADIGINCNRSSGAPPAVERLVDEAQEAGREGDESRAWELATEAKRRLQ